MALVERLSTQKKIASSLSLADERYHWLHVDQTGEPVEATQKETSSQRKNVPICIVLPASMAVLRSTDCKGLEKDEERQAAIRLWAEESLVGNLEDYIVDYWSPSKEAYALVAVPRTTLQQAREHLNQRHGKLINIIVPELVAPKAPGTTFVIWFSDRALLLCQWRDQVLREWHALPYQIGHTRMGEIFEINSLFGPDRIILVGDDVTQLDVPGRLSQWGWDSAIETTDEWFSIRDQFCYDLNFDEFISEAKYLPAEPQQWLRLAMGGVALCVSLTFFAYANLHFLNREAQQLEDQVSKLRISAHRSDEVAFRISETLDRVNAFNALTIDRKGAIDIVQSMTEKLPDDVRFNTMSISRQGKVVIDGEAKNELGPTVFLTSLGVIEFVDEPKLRFSEQQRQTSSGATGLAAGEAPATKYQIEFNTLAPLLSLPSAQEVL